MNTSITVNEQDIAIYEFLKENGVEYTVTYLQDNSQDQDWQYDLFSVCFKKGNNSFRSEFKTGLGHRVSRFKNGYTTLRSTYNKTLDKVGLKGCLHNVSSKQFAVSPTSANVLHCLLLDSQLGEDLFEDFCANLGYSEDSIKALESYRACQKTCTNLRKVFTNTQLQQLSEILEDY